jgi:hypothetical protein
MRIYPKHRMKREDGSDSRFFYMPDGSLYDGYDGETILRVGTINSEGQITVRTKYGRKYGHRLDEAFQKNKTGENNE